MLEKIVNFRKRDLTSLILTGTLVFGSVLGGCGKREDSAKPKTEIQRMDKTNLSFEDELPQELAEVCVLYTRSKLSGGELDRLAYAKTSAYLYQHPDDPRACYLLGFGASQLADYEMAFGAYSEALDIGLPEKQKNLVKEQIDAFEFLSKSKDFKKKVTKLFSASGAILGDIKEIASKVPSFEKYELEDVGYPLDCSRLMNRFISEDGKSYQRTAAAELEFAPYSTLLHSSEAKTITNQIFEAAFKMQNKGDFLEVSGIVKTNLRFLYNFIASKYAKNQSIEAFNGIEILLNQPEQLEDLVVIPMLPSTLQNTLEYWLGEEEGRERFLFVGNIIMKSRDKTDVLNYQPRADEYWERLAPDEQKLLSGEKISKLEKGHS